MECKKLRTLSKVSLVISVLPLATLIPVFLNEHAVQERSIIPAIKIAGPFLKNSINTPHLLHES